MPRKVILLRGNAREESGIADATITPGMLLEFETANGLSPHAGAGAAAAAIFARAAHEDDGDGIDDNIASGSEVTAIYPEKGAKINAVTDETIDRGEFVQSAGDGKVALFDSGVIIGVASAASDLSGTVGRVEIIII
jgi:hypothetical protein